MADGIHILVLNYNGRELLEECLPSVVHCARNSTAPCRVSVIDNSSSDDSVGYVRQAWPDVAVLCMPNRGLVSFNDAVRRVSEPVVVLLNNDVQLLPGCVDRLASALVCDSGCFLAGPQCWGFDGAYEGTRSALCFRRGLVHTRLQPPLDAVPSGLMPITASAGAVLAVARDKFLALGGFDELFLPGRYEDLDFAFRGWLAGWKAVYVPEAVALHRRSATFTKAFGRFHIDQLDSRNALLFAWKNLRDPGNIARHLFYLVMRLVWSVLTGQQAFLGGWVRAVRRFPAAITRRAVTAGRVRTEYELFKLLEYR